jgi:hypothetical protein
MTKQINILKIEARRSQPALKRLLFLLRHRHEISKEFFNTRLDKYCYDRMVEVRLYA